MDTTPPLTNDQADAWFIIRTEAAIADRAQAAQAAKDAANPRHKAYKLIDSRINEIIAVQIDLALAGDSKAAALLINKRIAHLKPIDQPLEPISIDHSAPIDQQMAEVTKLMFAGQITLEQANILSGLLLNQMKAIDDSELRADVEQLVAQVNGDRRKRGGFK